MSITATTTSLCSSTSTTTTLTLSTPLTAPPHLLPPSFSLKRPLPLQSSEQALIHVQGYNVVCLQCKHTGEEVGGVTQVTPILMKGHAPCWLDHALHMAGSQELAHKSGQFLLIVPQLVGEVFSIISEQEPNHLPQKSSAEGGKQWGVVETVTHIPSGGRQMHLSVGLILEVALQVEVLLSGEGLHILHNLGEECGVGGEEGVQGSAVIWTNQSGCDWSRMGSVYIPWGEVLFVDVEVCDVVVLPGEDEPEDLACRGQGGEADIWLGGVRLDSSLAAPIEEGDNEGLQAVFFIGGKLL